MDFHTPKGYPQLDDNLKEKMSTNLGSQHELRTSVDADHVLLWLREIPENVKVELHEEFCGLEPPLGLRVPGGVKVVHTLSWCVIQRPHYCL